MAAGYIYVLSNGATPSVVRVGKGPTLPAQIAQESTQADAVPSPSLVAYEEFSTDVDGVYTAVEWLLVDAGLIRRGDSDLLVGVAVSDAVKMVVRVVGARSKNAQFLELCSPFYQALRGCAEKELQEREGKQAVSLTRIRRRIVEDVTKAEGRRG
jgi:hypothetical protein